MKNERYNIFWYNIYAWRPIIIFKNMANKNAHRQDYGQKLTLYIEIYILLQRVPSVIVLLSWIKVQPLILGAVPVLE